MLGCAWQIYLYYWIRDSLQNSPLHLRIVI
jgi:hypothetical protein